MHIAEETDMASLTHLAPESLTKLGLPKPTTIDLVGGILCHICRVTFANKKDYDAHYGTHETDTKKVIYTCVICFKEIAGYPSFRGHCYTMHVVKEKFKCEYCFKRFSKVTALKEHINVKHQFKCGACSKEFNTKKELQLHRIIHNQTDTPPYNCQMCETKIDSVEGCHKHIDMHCKFIYTCPICNESISNVNNASDHLKFHFDEEVEENEVNNQTNLENKDGSIEKLGGISCSLCSNAYKNRMEFDAHFSCYHGDEDIVYTCTACGKQFEKYSVFSNHAYNHFAKDRFECKICSKTFSRISLLVTHMSHCQNDNGATGKPFVCFKCNHRYGTESRLREHLRESHAIFQLKCLEEGCDEQFKTSKELILHQRLHSPIKQWCGQCGYLFTSLHSCQQHLNMHRKRLFICPICNRNYSDKHPILKHVNQHFETVLHMCKFCGKVYNAKNRLMEHMKTHSETKIHSCKYCNKSFTKLAQLQGHLNVHTGAKPYKCPICPKSFTSYPNWSKHLHRMHNVDGDKYKKEIKSMEKQNAFRITNNDSESVVDNSNESVKEIEASIENAEMDACDNLAQFIGMNNTLNLRLESYGLCEPDDSNIGSDSIDHIIIENEIKFFENNIKPDNNAIQNIIVSSTTEPVQELRGDLPQYSQTFDYPPEYGPEFINADPEIGCSSGFINLDDHNLPHIDPLLTIKIEEHKAMYVETPHYQGNFTPNIDYNNYVNTPKWEPPIITKVQQDLYGYEMTEASKLMLLNNDNFEVFT